MVRTNISNINSKINAVFHIIHIWPKVLHKLMIAGSPYSKMCRKSNSMKCNLVDQHPLCIYLEHSFEEHSDSDLLFFWPLRGTSVFVGHIEWPHCVCFKNISSEETAAVISVSLFSALLEGMILRSDMGVK